MYTYIHKFTYTHSLSLSLSLSLYHTHTHTHSRIMIINPQGEVHNPLNQTRISSYDGLRELVDLMFPPVVENREVLINIMYLCVYTHARTRRSPAPPRR